MTAQVAGADAAGGDIFAKKKEAVLRAFGGAGAYCFARWRRPIVPVVFGVDDATLAAVKGGIEAVVALAGHKMAETDAEMGANLFVFFLRDWPDLAGAAELEGLVGPVAPLAARLAAADARRHVLHRLEEDGAIRAAVVLERVAGGEDAGALSLALAARALLSWGPDAPAPVVAGQLSDEAAALIRAAYDPVLPAASMDASHAMRLAARMMT
ncbi:hypothetical protein ACEYYB_05810 [Paracoccus sp. p4-l81]|uniref:hypothetical protein n=1 Tax=Paracoccus sp. p4-l81 TaxID=3342806 RepID=UPI0035BB6CAE